MITAILCHHYGNPEERFCSVRRCRELLDPGGVLVIVENVLAETESGHHVQRQRWAAWQRAQGRDTAAVDKHMAREGVVMRPVAVREHQQLLEALGFAWFELVWRAYGQAGFVAQAP